MLQRNITFANMQNIMSRHFRIIIILFVIYLTAGCSAPRKAARLYTEQAQMVSVMLLTTDTLYRIIPDDEELSHLEELNRKHDSAAAKPEAIIKNVTEERYFQLFSKSFTSELRKYGLQVYTEDQMEEFNLAKGELWMINLAQVELTESPMVFTDEEMVNGSLYNYDISYNQVNIGSWFEFAQVNAPGEKQPEILFASYDVRDGIEGYFTQNIFTGEVGYQLNIDTLDVTRFEMTLVFLGRLYAGYSFDHLMNSYVRQQLPSDTAKYYRYDPYRKTLFTTGLDKFVPLD